MPINISNLSKDFQNSKRVLSDVTVKLLSEDITVIIGQNGSGKSTLLNCIAGLLPFENGIINVETPAVSYDLNANEQKQIPLLERKKIGYIFQQKVLWHHFTAIENVTHPLTKIHGFSKEKALEKAKEYFGILEFDIEHHKKYPNQLSGGQQRKVAIARTLSIEPDLLLIDELEANLDQSTVKLTLDFIENRFIKANKTVLMVSHSIDALERFTPHILLLHEGKVAATAKGVQELLNNQDIDTARIIKKSVDPSSRRWFIANQSLETAIEISKLNINEKNRDSLLTEIAKNVTDLITSYDPDSQHLLMIATRCKNDLSTFDVKIRCLAKSEGFILDGKDVPKLSEKVSQSHIIGGKMVFCINMDHQGAVSLKSSHTEHHNSLIDFIFDTNGKGLAYKFSERHSEIPGVYNISIPIPDKSNAEKESYYEFSNDTKNVYLIGCIVDGEVKGIISIDTYSKEKWTNFIIQQLVLIGNIVAIY